MVASSPTSPSHNNSGGNGKYTAEFFQKLLESPQMFGLVPLVFCVGINSLFHSVEPILSIPMQFIFGMFSQISGWLLVIPLFQGFDGGKPAILLQLTFFLVSSYFETSRQAAGCLFTHEQYVEFEKALTSSALGPMFVPFLKGRIKPDKKTYYNLNTYNLLTQISNVGIDPKKFAMQCFLAFVLAGTSGNFMEKFFPSGNPTQAASNLIIEVSRYGFVKGECNFADPKNPSSQRFCHNDINTTPIPAAKYNGPKFRTEPKINIPFIVAFFLYSCTFWEGELLNIPLSPRIDRPEKVVTKNGKLVVVREIGPYLKYFIFGLLASYNVITSAESMVLNKSDVFTSIIMHAAFLAAWTWCGFIPTQIQEDVLTKQETLRKELTAKKQKQVKEIAEEYGKKKYVHTGVSLGDWIHIHCCLNVKHFLGAITEEQYNSEKEKYEKKSTLARHGAKSGQFCTATKAEILKLGTEFHQKAIEGNRKWISQNYYVFEKAAKEKEYGQASNNANPNTSPAQATPQKTQVVGGAAAPSPGIQTAVSPNPVATSLNAQAPATPPRPPQQQ